MTKHLLTLSAVAALAFGLAACGERSEPDAAPASDVVADVPASEAAPAATAASDVAAEVPAETTPVIEPTEPDPDEVAAAGDTRRRTDETPAEISPPPPTR
jgi:predicted small lipoprotein YifL